MNADGSAVVGYSSLLGGVSPQAILWTPTSGLVGLGYLSGNDSSDAFGTSADGSVVVGNSYSNGNCCNHQAFRWTAAGGMAGLGFLTGYPISYAAGVNANGSVVVGVSYVGSLSQNQAFRWTAAGGVVGLGYLPGGGSSFATAVNADGSVAVGGSTTAIDLHNYQAFRWTQSGGMEGLGYLSGDNFSSANAVNGDGTVVVGCSGSNGFCKHAFLWTAADGLKSVQALLAANNVSTSGWTLTIATGVSADGLVIVGHGVDPYGQEEGWIARLGTPFIGFSAKLAIQFGSIPTKDAFGSRFNFILSSTAPTINPVTDPVTFQVGTFTTTIPPGSFKMQKDGSFAFQEKSMVWG